MSGRPEAIELLHYRRISGPEDVDLYLAEARAVAGLDHPGIVRSVNEKPRDV